MLKKERNNENNLITNENNSINKDNILNIEYVFNEKIVFFSRPTPISLSGSDKLKILD